jgi:hypothetical protein
MEFAIPEWQEHIPMTSFSFLPIREIEFQQKFRPKKFQNWVFWWNPARFPIQASMAG